MHIMSAKSLTLYLESDLSKPSLIAFVLLFCVAFASRVDAASVAGLYEASVPVGSQTSTDREAAFREALDAYVAQKKLAEPDSFM